MTDYGCYVNQNPDGRCNFYATPTELQKFCTHRAPGNTFKNFATRTSPSRLDITALYRYPGANYSKYGT